MEHLRKVRQSAMFVDVVLVIMAIVSIIGLSVFVRFHGSPKPASAAPATKTLSPSDSFAVLPASTEESSQGSSTSTGAPAANTSQPVNTPTTAAISGPPISIPYIPPSSSLTLPTIPVKVICDETKKAVLLATYYQKKTEEDDRFNKAVKARYGLIGGLFTTIEAVTQQLKPEHQQNLNALLSSLQTQLAAIHCSL